jgi:cytochrome aa3-600 menaquinol oxidase subunit IV
LMFMHWTEGSGTYQVVTTLYGVFVAVVTVVGSVWIFFGMYGI